jgi:hypothetical protein
MSKITFQPFILRLMCIVLISGAFIIHGCKKDNKSVPVADPTINRAKEWYEATYSTPIIRATNKINSSAGTAGNNLFDYTKHIKPDWQHGAKYTRYKADVIELPLDPSSDKIRSGFKNMTTGKMVYQPQYSRSSFLLLHDGTGYRAYVMTIIGDSAYMKNDPGKLALTTYRKRDPNFSGVVAYFTPDGKFVASFGYMDGKLIPATLPSTTSAATANTKSTARFRPTARELMVSNCIDWYMCYFENDVMVSKDYLYTTCDVVDSGGSSASGGTSPPPPVPCPTSPPPANSSTTNTHAMIRVAAPSPTPIGDDGGLPPPPPPTQTTETCPVVVTQPIVSSTNTITDSVTNPCLKAIIDNLTNNKTIQTDVTNVLRNTFGVNDQVNITFNEGILTGSHSADDANTSGNQLNNLVVTFNTPAIASASKEYLLETTMHEIYHAYLDVNTSLKGSLSQHAYMIKNYVTTEVATLQKVFPSLSLHDAQCLVLAGYGDIDPTTFGMALTAFNLTSGDVATTNNSYKSGAIGIHC